MGSISWATGIVESTGRDLEAIARQTVKKGVKLEISKDVSVGATAESFSLQKATKGAAKEHVELFETKSKPTVPSQNLALAESKAIDAAKSLIKGKFGTKENEFKNLQVKRLSDTSFKVKAAYHTYGSFFNRLFPYASLETKESTVTVVFKDASFKKITKSQLTNDKTTGTFMAMP